MKSKIVILLGMLIAVFIISSCEDKIESTMSYIKYEPVYKTAEEIRDELTILPPVPATQSGRIYLYDNYILLNDPGKGIHIIDNTNPKSPKKVSFVNIPGNYNMSIRNDVLYVDSYMDLVALQFKDPESIEEIGRIKNIFEGISDWKYVPDKGIITDYVKVGKEEISNDVIGGQYRDYFYESGRGLYFFNGQEDYDVAYVYALEDVNMAPGGKNGVGGSMAQFTIVNDHLFAIDSYKLYSFDITNLESPVKNSGLEVGWGIETLFPYTDKLFIGSQTGMYIYNISNPAMPEFMSMYNHFSACDPVVVQNDIAYVTLRNGASCMPVADNVLQLIDVKDAHNPKLLYTYEMESPHGLGIDDSLLFICEGDFGLKIFNAKEPDKIDKNKIEHYKDIHAFDVIPYKGRLLMTGEDGLFQYDYTEPNAIKLLSKFSVMEK